jgi:hypothetical protein
MMRLGRGSHLFTYSFVVRGWGMTNFKLYLGRSAKQSYMTDREQFGAIRHFYPAGRPNFPILGLSSALPGVSRPVQDPARPGGSH